MMKRREFILQAGVAGVGLGMMPGMLGARAVTGIKGLGKEPFELPQLGYAYDALEPHIDAMTMEIHHSKHHAGYVKKLNAALEGHRLAGKGLMEILEEVSGDTADTGVLNNAGGHYNHSLFWEVIRPGGAAEPSGNLNKAIIRDFGSYAQFTEIFTKTAGTIFGSGWAWLSLDSQGKLFVSGTRNQENPLMKNVVDQRGRPILGIDVWEHAYYLNYQNRRADYIAHFMEIINWDQVGQNFDAC